MCVLREELLPILLRGNRGNLSEGHVRKAMFSFLFYFGEIIPAIAINTHSLLWSLPSFFMQYLWDASIWWEWLLGGFKVDWFGCRQKVVHHTFAFLRYWARLSHYFLNSTISRLGPVLVTTLLPTATLPYVPKIHLIRDTYSLTTDVYLLLNPSSSSSMWAVVAPSS